jgi:hypothetical protein
MNVKEAFCLGVSVRSLEAPLDGPTLRVTVAAFPEGPAWTLWVVICHLSQNRVLPSIYSGEIIRRLSPWT